MSELLRVGDLTPATPITIDSRDGSIAMAVNDVLAWLAPEAPPGEALRFLLVCRSARINPFDGEAYLIKYGDKWQIVTDRYGWLHRAENHPAYDGIESGIVVQKIESTQPTVKYSGDLIDIAGTTRPDGYGVRGGWARVHRKDRQFSTYVRLSLDEYRKDTPTWKKILATMICKTAEVHALRKSGVVHSRGVYAIQEMPANPALPPRPDPGPLPPAVKAEYQMALEMPSLSPDLAIELQHAIEQVGMSDYQVQVMLSRRGVGNMTELTDMQAQEVIVKLHAEYDRQHAGEIMLPDKADQAEPATEVTDDGEVIEVKADPIPTSDVEGEQLTKEVKAMEEAAANFRLPMGDEGLPGEVQNEIEEVIDPAMTEQREAFGSDEPEIPDVPRPDTPTRKSRKKARPSDGPTG